MMGHDAIPSKWKEFLFHRGCSFSVKSVLDAGIVAGGKESKEGRQTVFFTPLDPWCNETDEEFDGDQVEKSSLLEQVEMLSGRRPLDCTNAEEIKDGVIKTKNGLNKFPFEKSFNVLV